MISVARTGSGKTCAFLLPGLQKILTSPKSSPDGDSSSRNIRRSRRDRPPKVLILAPTRELCVQIGILSLFHSFSYYLCVHSHAYETGDEANKYGSACSIPTAVLYGGAGSYCIYIILFYCLFRMYLCLLWS